MIKKVSHIAIAVNSLEEGSKTYAPLGLKVAHTETVSDQGVKIAFIPVGDSEIELVEPIDPNGGVAKFLKTRGEGIHHICLEVDNIDREVKDLMAKGTEMIDKQPRKGAAGMVAFVHPKSTKGVLMELCQKVKK
jgi:lactoylglutathione lyase/methylmalonyl-CoA/ethylmalonyl-CoA epimerase